MNLRRVELVLYGLAVLLVGAALVYPSGPGITGDDKAGELAQAGLQRLAEGERALYAEGGKYVGFGTATADRRTILPKSDLGPEFDPFSFDAVVDRNHDLQLRVVSRVDAVAAGRLTPVLKTLTLTGHR